MMPPIRYVAYNSELKIMLSILNLSHTLFLPSKYFKLLVAIVRACIQ